MINGGILMPYEFQSTLPMRGETSSMRSRRSSLSFQSTLPMRGETVPDIVLALAYLISIHSPHAGRDVVPVCILSGRG